MDARSDAKGSGRSRSVGLGVFLIIVAIVAVLVGRFGMPNINLGALNPFAGTSTTQVSGVIGSEKRAYFEDEDVKKRFKKLGYEVDVQTAGSREIAETVDLSAHDFVFPSSEPATEKVERVFSSDGATYPFHSPMAVATFQPIVDILTRQGLIREDGPNKVLDVQGIMELAQNETRWRDLGDEFPSPRTVQISTTDIRTSNSAAMYLSILAWVISDMNPEHAEDTGFLAKEITPFFTGQGYTASSSAGPFADYLSQGMGAAPMVLVYEAQYLGEQMKPNSRIGEDNVLLYLYPTVQAKHGVVGLTEEGKEIARLLAEDSELQELAARHGFRPNNSPAFEEVMAEHELTPPETYLATVDPPSYERLEELMTEVGKAYSTPPQEVEEY
ncbi:hypothetical protein [Corynebacterium sp.]|uniref:hypothetical protein n=1 Tax=Corynebacterium sp. TaxID=1720 RepID=UPI003735A7C0